MNELALFAGAGGGLLASKLLGWSTVCAVEIEPYCRKVLIQRQKDKILERFPIWDDVRTFDGKPWKGIIDVISGGFPCQDISKAGKGAGIEGKQSGLWKEFARIIREVRPSFVFVENAPALLLRGMGVVLGDLAASGYDARWDCFPASAFNADHIRDRIWIVAHAVPGGWKMVCDDIRCGDASASKGKKQITSNVDSRMARFARLEKRLGQPAVFRTNNDVAHRVDRLGAVGNGQVPIVAATAFRILASEWMNEWGGMDANSGS